MSQSKQHFANFSYCWKIEWSQLEQLPTKNIIKSFITAHNNVPLFWRAEFGTVERETGDRVSFFVYYEEGPLAKLKDIFFAVQIMQPGRTNWRTCFTVESDLGLERMIGFKNIGEPNAKSFQEEHDLLDSEPFYCRCTVKVPISTFSYFPENPLQNVESSPFLRDLFERVEDSEEGTFSDAKLISRDGKIFQCHKPVIGNQSSELAAMFRHPKAENQKENEYEFPNLSTSALKSLIEFIYTGKATFDDLSTKDLIEVADAAEQYNFKKLKESCGVWLWKKVAEKPEDACDVVLFANLHRDIKHLKHRAFDVLADNYDKFSLYDADELSGKFCDDSDLVKEFNFYMHRRVEADFDEK